MIAIHDQDGEFLTGSARVRSVFTNCRGTVVNEVTDAADVRRLLVRVLDLAFESLRHSEGGTLRFTISSPDNASPLVAEVSRLAPHSTIHKGQSYEQNRDAWRA